MYLTTAAKGLLTATIIMMFIFAYTLDLFCFYVSKWGIVGFETWG